MGCWEKPIKGLMMKLADTTGGCPVRSSIPYTVEQAENILGTGRKALASSSVSVVPSTKNFNIAQAGKREMIH